MDKSKKIELDSFDVTLRATEEALEALLTMLNNGELGVYKKKAPLLFAAQQEKENNRKSKNDLKRKVETRKMALVDATRKESRTRAPYVPARSLRSRVLTEKDKKTLEEANINNPLELELAMKKKEYADCRKVELQRNCLNVNSESLGTINHEGNKANRLSFFERIKGIARNLPIDFINQKHSREYPNY